MTEKRLRDFRVNAEMTVRDLSSASGLSIGYISMLESGKVDNPTPKKIDALEQALGLDGELYLEFGRIKRRSE